MVNSFKLSLLFGTLFNISIVICANDNQKTTLQHVHVISRHANRTVLPGQTFPTDAHMNETYYPFGRGELTLIGKQLAFEHGKSLKKRYNNILSPIYYPPEIQAFSTNSSRTQMTLQAVLTALYPPLMPYYVYPFLRWQPISYQTLPADTDNLLAIPCLDFKFKTKIDDKLQAFYDFISLHTGIKMENSISLLNIYDVLLVQTQNGFEVPDWAKEIFNNGILKYEALTGYTDINEYYLTIVLGRLIKKITDDASREMTNELSSKLFLYSVHDMTISTLLGLFEMYGPTNKYTIEYLATIFIELHKIKGRYGYKVFFQNGPNNPVTQLYFKSCKDNFCPIDDFIESTKYTYSPELRCP